MSKIRVSNFQLINKSCTFPSLTKTEKSFFKEIKKRDTKAIKEGEKYLKTTSDRIGVVSVPGELGSEKHFYKIESSP
jgi:hypothetical protein